MANPSYLLQNQEEETLAEPRFVLGWQLRPDLRSYLARRVNHLLWPSLYGL